MGINGKTQAAFDATTGAEFRNKQNQFSNIYAPHAEFINAIATFDGVNPPWLKCEDCTFGLLHWNEETENDYVFCMAGPPPWLTVPSNAFCGRFTPRSRTCFDCAWWEPLGEINFAQGICSAKGPDVVLETGKYDLCATWSLRWEPYLNKAGRSC
jgi:hypothetical protein